MSGNNLWSLKPILPCATKRLVLIPPRSSGTSKRIIKPSHAEEWATTQAISNWDWKAEAITIIKRVYDPRVKLRKTKEYKILYYCLRRFLTNKPFNWQHSKPNKKTQELIRKRKKVSWWKSSWNSRAIVKSFFRVRNWNFKDTVWLTG